MDWLATRIDQLGDQCILSYGAGQRPATEPTAVAALALAAHGRFDRAFVAAEWLRQQQAADGSVGIRLGDPEPRWPTSLAVLAWQACRSAGSPEQAAWLGQAIDRAVAWQLSCRGTTHEQDREMGHDTTLVAWPWVEGTHSWIEPTAMSVLALKTVGHGAHQRTREAIRMLLDRMLERGGCNYGNTRVLGQTLRPHQLPTGLALTALAREADVGQRISRSLQYLRGSLTEQTPVLSLAWSVLGLAAHDSEPVRVDDWLAQAAARGGSTASLAWSNALLCLAAGRHSVIWSTSAVASESPALEGPSR